MTDETQDRRRIFGAIGILPALSIPGVTLFVMGAAQLFTMPQGIGFPADPTFWHPLIPYGIVALVALCIAGLSWQAKRLRNVFLGLGILFGGGTLGFGMMYFALAERVSLDELVQATPTAPENTYTCTRQSDGTMACLNALGEADPGFSSRVVAPSINPP